MKLFCRDEMQRLEMAAVTAGITLAQLMENAGAALAQEVESRCRPMDQPIGWNKAKTSSD